jgi:hypothetical protein
MSEEVDSHIVERYDIQKRLGKGVLYLLNTRIFKFNFIFKVLMGLSGKQQTEGQTI